VTSLKLLAARLRQWHYRGSRASLGEVRPRHAAAILPLVLKCLSSWIPEPQRAGK